VGTMGSVQGRLVEALTVPAARLQKLERGLESLPVGLRSKTLLALLASSSPRSLTSREPFNVFCELRVLRHAVAQLAANSLSGALHPLTGELRWLYLDGWKAPISPKVEYTAMRARLFLLHTPSGRWLGIGSGPADAADAQLAYCDWTEFNDTLDPAHHRQELLVHAGAARLAEQMWKLLLPHLEAAELEVEAARSRVEVAEATVQGLRNDDLRPQALAELALARSRARVAAAPWRVSGHGIGGAAAEIIAMKLLHRFKIGSSGIPIASVCTFGAPKAWRAASAKYVAECLRGILLHVGLSEDPIPHLPPDGVMPSGCMIPEVTKQPGPLLLLPAVARSGSPAGSVLSTAPLRPKVWVIQPEAAPTMPTLAIVDAWNDLSTVVDQAEHNSSAYLVCLKGLINRLVEERNLVFHSILPDEEDSPSEEENERRMEIAFAECCSAYISLLGARSTSQARKTGTSQGPKAAFEEAVAGASQFASAVHARRQQTEERQRDASVALRRALEKRDSAATAMAHRRRLEALGRMSQDDRGQKSANGRDEDSPAGMATNHQEDELDPIEATTSSHEEEEEGMDLYELEDGTMSTSPPAAPAPAARTSGASPADQAAGSHAPGADPEGGHGLDAVELRSAVPPAAAQNMHKDKKRLSKLDSPKSQTPKREDPGLSWKPEEFFNGRI